MLSLTPATEPPPAIVASALPPTVKGPSATVRTSTKAPLRMVWEAFVPVALSEVFPNAKGPVPAVRSTSGQDGRWDVAGRSRSVRLGDGSTVREEITSSNPTNGAPASGKVATFSYRVSGFTGPIGILAKEAHGTWRFEQTGPETTTIEWRYTFVPKGLLSSVPLRFVLATFWRSYMSDGLENVRRIAERQERQAEGS